MAALLIHHCDKFGCLPVTVQHQPLINRHICPPKTVHLLRSLIAVAAANWENHQESVQFKGQIISVNKCESKLSHGPCLGKARYEETNAVIMLICRVVPMHKVGFTRAQPTFTSGRISADKAWLGAYAWDCHRLQLQPVPPAIQGKAHVGLILGWIDCACTVHHSASRFQQPNCSCQELALVPAEGQHLLQAPAVRQSRPDSQGRAGWIQEHGVKALCLKRSLIAVIVRRMGHLCAYGATLGFFSSAAGSSKIALAAGIACFTGTILSARRIPFLQLASQEAIPLRVL
mmetsp:Transcript_5921/g.15743  ORF Transcript_5921/g.15743 Transcript_5921/m.15743 type:complete len:288 (+) Transcript_5921:468-1331(+)